MAAFIPLAAAALPHVINAFSSKGDSGYEPHQVYTKGQMKIQGQQEKRTQKLGAPGGGFDQVLQQLIDMLNPNSEQQKSFEDPYRQEFEQKTIPGLAERFAGAGAEGGALSSSGFGQALSSAGANLQTNLAQQTGQRRQDAMKQIMDLYQNMVQNTLSAEPYAYVNKQQGGGMGGGTAQGLANISPGAWQDIYNSLKGGGGGNSPVSSSNNSSGGVSSYQKDYPLTSYGYSNNQPAIGGR